MIISTMLLVEIQNRETLLRIYFTKNNIYEQLMTNNQQLFKN